MTLETVAPYGADVDAEIRHLFEQEREAFCDLVIGIVSVEYGLRAPLIERLHVAAGLALTIRSDAKRYVLKLDSHNDEAALRSRLKRLNLLRDSGISLPEIIPTVAGNLFVVVRQEHDKAYLMSFATGASSSQWTSESARATAEVLAGMHRLGQRMPRQPGEEVTLDAFWPEVASAIDRLRGELPADLLSAAGALIAAAPSTDGLSWTHVHGDPRLCHFLFDGDRLSALVDHDEGGWGHRVGDVAYTVVSHPDPADLAFLSIPQIQEWLEVYEALEPLNEVDRAMLRPAIAGVLLHELEQILSISPRATSAKGRSSLRRAEQLLTSIVEGRIGIPL